jgi:hypothetical protein
MPLVPIYTLGRNTENLMAQLDLNGVRMRVTVTAETGVVSSETELVFEQIGAVVSARYRGGSVVDGYLIGLLEGMAFRFRYIQADIGGRIDAGTSEGRFERLLDERLRLTEEFQWTTRPNGGTNVFEEAQPLPP